MLLKKNVFKAHVDPFMPAALQDVLINRKKIWSNKAEVLIR